MSQYAKEITTISIEQELKNSYLDYAMSVIVSRALPDVRDGLKPVHRRILYAMRELGNVNNKPYKKSARIVGDVIGKYHPHGDSAVYEAVVRMAQSFSLRYPLIDGQGNFGSIDGDAPAAMRYTEIRLGKISDFLLAELDKETVDFVPNYDGTEFIPEVLPTLIPNLLINGSSGIAVGMATNIPPHNLGEVINACMAIIDNPEIGLDDLIRIIPGPDFPTAGIINGITGIKEAYETGRGKILIRSKVNIECDEISNKQTIVINELPYQVNKSNLIIKIVDLIKNKKIEGISAIRDESDKDGMRIAIEIKKGESADVVLNNLFINTQLQITFGINIVALDKGQPKTLNLKQVLNAFINHRKEVVTRKCNYELNQALKRAHILEGLGIAIDNIDSIILLIKSAGNPYVAKQNMLEKIWQCSNNEFIDSFGKKYYNFTDIQAQSILELRLHRLTKLECNEILSEYKEILKKIEILNEILSNQDKLLNVIKNDLINIKKLFSDRRRTEIMDLQKSLTEDDLVVSEDVVVTLSHHGYAKIQAITDYRSQKRGGKGKASIKVKDNDFIERLFIANTHDNILCFSNYGRVYQMKVYSLPYGNGYSRGKPLINLLQLDENEKINTILSISSANPDSHIIMATSRGIVKKVKLSEFLNLRLKGIIAIDLFEDDKLIGAILTKESQDIMLFSNAGKAVRFNDKQIRAMGRGARGVRGMRLKDGQKVISLLVVSDETKILVATERGYGKCTNANEFQTVNRGASGVIAIRVNKRNGKAVSAIPISNIDDEIVIISDRGTLVRIRAKDIPLIGRNTQGAKLFNVGFSENLVDIQRIIN